METSELLGTAECQHCGDRFDRPSSRGPAPLYCSTAHRQAAYLARRWTQLVDERDKLSNENVALKAKVARQGDLLRELSAP